MKSLSTALASALGAPVQQPALLVQVGFSAPQRWSSFATVTWNGQTWTREDIRIEELAVNALEITGTLVIGNADGAAGALVLAEGVTDRTVQIWGYDAAATALADVVWLASAVGASAQVDPQAVRIQLRHAAEMVLGPRTFLQPGAGFGPMLAPGTVIRVNGIDYQLERR